MSSRADTIEINAYDLKGFPAAASPVPFDVVIEAYVMPVDLFSSSSALGFQGHREILNATMGTEFRLP